jgi:hypothetical protein
MLSPIMNYELRIMNLLLLSYIQNLLKINLLRAMWNIWKINRVTYIVGVFFELSPFEIDDKLLLFDKRIL